MAAPALAAVKAKADARAADAARQRFLERKRKAEASRLKRPTPNATPNPKCNPKCKRRLASAEGGRNGWRTKPLGLVELRKHQPRESRPVWRGKRLCKGTRAERDWVAASAKAGSVTAGRK